MLTLPPGPPPVVPKRPSRGAIPTRPCLRGAGGPYHRRRHRRRATHSPPARPPSGVITPPGKVIHTPLPPPPRRWRAAGPCGPSSRPSKHRNRSRCIIFTTSSSPGPIMPRRILRRRDQRRLCPVTFPTPSMRLTKLGPAAIQAASPGGTAPVRTTAIPFRREAACR